MNTRTKVETICKLVYQTYGVTLFWFSDQRKNSKDNNIWSFVYKLRVLTCIQIVCLTFQKMYNVTKLQTLRSRISLSERWTHFCSIKMNIIDNIWNTTFAFCVTLTIHKILLLPSVWPWDKDIKRRFSKLWSDSMRYILRCR